MTDDPDSPSARASLRAERRTRRKDRLAQRESVFEMVASGYDLEVIAATLEISVATVRRELAGRSPSSGSTRPSATPGCRSRGSTRR